MSKNSFICGASGVLFLLVVCVVCRAGDCPYGSVQARFKRSEGTWENATAHPVLHLGETFEIQVVVTTWTALSVLFLKLHEFGTPVYEVLDGPSKIEQILEHRGMILPSQNFSYIWSMQVRIDTPWINGYAPLEMYAQFNKNDRELASIHFDVLNAFITDEAFDHHQEDASSATNASAGAKNHRTPSTGIGGIVFIVAFFVLVHRRRKQKGNDSRWKPSIFLSEKKIFRGRSDRKDRAAESTCFSHTRV